MGPPELAILALRGTPSHGHRMRARLAAIGMAVILLATLAGGLGAAALLYRASQDVERAMAVPGHLQAARREIVAARALDREYRPSSGAEVRSRQEQAQAAVLGSLRAAAQAGSAADQASVTGIRETNDTYRIAVGRAQTAADAGTRGLSDTILLNEAGPIASRLDVQLEAAITRSLGAASARVQDLMRLLRLGLMAGPPALLGVLVALGVLWTMLRRAQARLEDGLIREASAICHNEQFFRSLVKADPDMVLVCAASGQVTFQGPAAESAWGHPAGTLLNQAVLAMAHPDDQPSLAAAWRQVQPVTGELAAPQAGAVRLHLRVADGRGAWREAELHAVDRRSDPVLQGILVTIREASSARGAEQAQAQAALLDRATRVPNRTLFRDRLDQALLRATRDRGGVALWLVQLPGKVVDTEEAADALMIDAVARLRACIRPTDTVARLGEARLAIIHEVRDAPVRECQAEAGTIARAIVEQFSRPFHPGGVALALETSIGIAFADPRQDTVDSLVAKSQVAVDQARARAATGAGVGSTVRWALFDPTPTLNELDRVELASDLRAADIGREMRIHYQPIVTIATGELEGVEALIRWQHPTRGLVSPGEFVPIAEETGLIVPLGRWILAETCRQVAEWQALYHFEPPLTASVNLSARQFHSPGLVDEVAAALSGAGLPARCLKLEIAESAIMGDLDATVRITWALNRLGVQLAIDDFGTGYSSLSFLKQLPLDLLKIDGSFIQGIGTNEEDTAIVRGIIACGTALGLRITGENIETAEQAALLHQMGCHYGQGWLYSRAVGEVDAVAFLRTPETVSRWENAPARIPFPTA